MSDIVLNTLPENEILRYLGCPPDDENTLALVRPCAEDLCKTARPRTLRRAFPIRRGRHYREKRPVFARAGSCPRADRMQQSSAVLRDAWLGGGQLAQKRTAL